MKLLELLTAVEHGHFSCSAEDPRFHDVLEQLENEGAGLFEGVVRIMTAARDGELSAPASVSIKRLSPYGSATLQALNSA